MGQTRRSFHLTAAGLRPPSYSRFNVAGSLSLACRTEARRSTRARCRARDPRRAKAGGEGRTRTFEAARATDLQSAAFDRFATSPAVCVVGNADYVDYVDYVDYRALTHACPWSWRRDLNPRPADYKSAALPTELRQPEQKAKFSTTCAIRATGRRIP